VGEPFRRLIFKVAARTSPPLWRSRALVLGAWRSGTIAASVGIAARIPATGMARGRATAAIAPATISPTGIAATAAAALAGIGLVVAHARQHFCAGCLGSGLHYVAAGRLARSAPDGLAPHSNGFCALAFFRFESGHHFDFNGLFREALDVLHEAFFVQTHQVDRSAVGTGAARAADAVHVVF